MRKFSITVNGQAYEVEVEEIGGAPVFAPAPAAPAAPAAVQPAKATTAKAATPDPAAKPAQAPVANGGGQPVKAPMPGNILDVKVSAGQKVKKGDILLILEAMKMENEILAERDATVASIVVSKGSTVGSGDVLLTLS